MKHWTLALLILALPPSLAARDAQRQRPNVIFLLADDMRHDAAGFAGNTRIQTPHLDRLAGQSAVFQNAFVTTAICAVSRASIFSGQYARRHGINDFATRFTDQQWAQSYPALLRTNGYRVGFIGKFGVGNIAPTNTFDYWDGFNGQGRYLRKDDPNYHMTGDMGDSALRYLSQKDDRPFCLSISFKAPHAQDNAVRQFPPDPRDEHLYVDQTFPASPSVSEEAFNKLPAFVQKSEGRTRWKMRFANSEMRQQTIRDYYRLISGIDREVGRVRAELEKRGLARNTIIIFTSDHGFYLGEHGLAGKWFMHEESIRIPLVVYNPAAERQVKPAQTVLNIDMAPTILDYAGIEIPPGMQGRSLRSIAASQSPSSWRDDFYYEHHFSAGGRIPDSEGVRNGQWKYIRYTAHEPLVEQLYNHQADPFELNDLSGDPDHQATLEKLRHRWAEFRVQLQ